MAGQKGGRPGTSTGMGGHLVLLIGQLESSVLMADPDGRPLEDRSFYVRSVQGQCLLRRSILMMIWMDGLRTTVRSILEKLFGQRLSKPHALSTCSIELVTKPSTKLYIKLLTQLSTKLPSHPYGLSELSFTLFRLFCCLADLSIILNCLYELSILLGNLVKLLFKLPIRFFELSMHDVNLFKCTIDMSGCLLVLSMLLSCLVDFISMIIYFPEFSLLFGILVEFFLPFGKFVEQSFLFGNVGELYLLVSKLFEMSLWSTLDL
ncbi:hypothetical protein VIGAN_11055900 [Vigna angularis var. angularis]|uniref:Uncharacterized protein n=1 Tax=Vigna angularis var. angularis TaxID=157739 RepID=A0A0S3T8R8_PHAAN|nr:hypothetical protein VIGAN_11055900 [Vigna angularis var. angularis]